MDDYEREMQARQEYEAWQWQLQHDEQKRLEKEAYDEYCTLWNETVALDEFGNEYCLVCDDLIDNHSKLCEAARHD